MVKSLLLIVLASFLWFDSPGQRSPLNKIDSLISNEHFSEAQLLIDQATHATKDSRLTGLLTNRLAEILILQGKLDEAERVLKSVKSQNDKFLDAVTESNLGFLYINKARNDLALESLQQALTKFQESGNPSTRESANCLANLTLLYWSTGKLNQAEENGLIALQIRRQLSGENSEEAAASYNDLGLVYSSTDPDKARDYYEKALAIYQRIHGKESRKTAITSTNIGVINRNNKEYGEAVISFETALSIWTKLYPNGHPNQAAALLALGLTYQKMGNAASAMGYFQKALAIYRQSYGAKHPDISSVLNQIGYLQLDGRLFDAALNSFQAALISNSPTFNSMTVGHNPQVGEFYNGKVMLYSLRLKGQTFEAKHYSKTLKMEDLKQALGCLASCDTLIDNIRHQSTDENDKIELGETANEVYEDGVRVSEAISEMTMDFKRYREVAFYFAEKSKSAVLQESIADAEAKSFAGIPDQLIDQENILKSTIAFLSQKLSQKPSPEEEKQMRQSLFETNRAYNTFSKKLETDYPNYYNLKFNLAAPDTKGLQLMLDQKTAIVSYFVAESSKHIYEFVITRDRFAIHNKSLPPDFDKYLKGLANSLLYSDQPTYVKSASYLSKVLVPHLPGSITNLVIIPSGRLGTVPFETLFTGRSSATDYTSMPLLAKRYAISYEFSAGLMAQKAKASPAQVPLSIFLCAPVHFPEKDHLDDLPGTEAEVNSIAQLFGAANTSVAKFDEANEDLIKSGDLSKFNYLHFATHGVVDEADPELSRIFLQNGKKDDGNLFAGEIYNLRLNADLTVLSACQTGLGKYSKGEGVIGLSRALVYAGSKNIIVSFWSVADESTSQLMTDFYKILLQKKTSNFRETLQQAKIDMIKGGKFSAPYYWAPFILIGF